MDSTRDFTMPQLSAPMQPSSDFANAYQSSINAANRAQQPAEHRDFVGQLQASGDGLQHHQQHDDQTQVQHQHARSDDGNSFLRPNEYDTPHKRKRSFTMPGNFETA